MLTEFDPVSFQNGTADAGTSGEAYDDDDGRSQNPFASFFSRL